jgi:DNA polymerase V
MFGVTSATETTLDLNAHLIQHPSSTFFVKVQGESMSNSGMHHGDLLIIDRAHQAQNDDVVIAVVDGESFVRRLILQDDDIFLKPESYSGKTLRISSNMDFEIWGVVKWVIHKV